MALSFLLLFFRTALLLSTVLTVQRCSLLLLPRDTRQTCQAMSSNVCFRGTKVTLRVRHFSISFFFSSPMVIPSFYWVPERLQEVIGLAFSLLHCYEDTSKNSWKMELQGIGFDPRPFKNPYRRGTFKRSMANAHHERTMHGFWILLKIETSELSQKYLRRPEEVSTALPPYLPILLVFQGVHFKGKISEVLCVPSKEHGK